MFYYYFIRSFLLDQIIHIVLLICDMQMISALADRPSASRMARLLCDEVTTERFCPVAFPGGTDMILQYDEHVLNDTYKFGVVYQKFGQVSACTLSWCI